MPSRTSEKHRLKRRVSPSKNYSSRHRFYQRCLLLEQACQSCHKRLTHLSTTEQQLMQLRDETENECEEAWREREKLSSELRSLQTSNDLIQKETNARGPQLLKRLHSELEQVDTEIAEAKSHEKAKRITLKELSKQVKQAEDELQHRTCFLDELNKSLQQLNARDATNSILKQIKEKPKQDVSDKSHLYSLDESTPAEVVGQGETANKGNLDVSSTLMSDSEQVATTVTKDENHRLVDMDQLAIYNTYSDLSSLYARRETKGAEVTGEDNPVSDETDEEVLEEMTEKFSLSPLDLSLINERTGNRSLSDSPLKLDLTTSLKAGCETRRKVHFQAETVFLDAALEGEIDVVRTCLRQGRVDVDSKSGRGMTALHKAALRGSAQVVSLLLEKGADVNSQDPDGWTPLHCAVSVSNPEMVRHLVLNGASLFTPNDDGDTPLKLAYDECEALHEAGGTFYDKYSSASATECLHFLLKVQNEIGIINGGKVYSVYDYTAEHEDELTISTNEQLRVLKRSSHNDSVWWQAMNSLGKKGLVPGNYFTCYRYNYTSN